jgi:ectoine hydroxylase-related dioxygenase (phytanoyl-CoA dioxygenase family)
MSLTPEQVAAYDRDGFVLVEDVFSEAEVAAMLREVEGGERVSQTARGSADSSGKKAGIAIWHELGDDIWAAASTHPKIVNAVRILMREEIAFFHGKVMLKKARSGGAWEWHQDYGYWYEYEGFLFPRLMSAFVALDPATIENGCLQVLRGSHLLGRLEHGKVGEQMGANMSRIEAVVPHFERVYCEMKPGSVVYFHCNTLHTSAPNY